MVYGTSNGSIFHYDLDELVMINKYKHHTGIRKIYPQLDLGVNAIIIDDDLKGYIVNPLYESFDIPQWQGMSLYLL